MGFPLEACRKAVYYTGNLGAEVAFNWIIAHMEEPGQWLEGVSEVQLLIVYSSSHLKFWNVQQRNSAHKCATEKLPHPRKPGGVSEFS